MKGLLASWLQASKAGRGIQPFPDHEVKPLKLALAGRLASLHHNGTTT